MKNKSFKYTFYLGLTIILIITAVITMISLNIYKTITSKFAEKRKDTTIIETPLFNNEIVHDTIYLEKPTKKVIDTTKPKKDIKTSITQKIDSIVSNDTIN